MIKLSVTFGNKTHVNLSFTKSKHFFGGHTTIPINFPLPVR